ncbi:hypothetical protein JOF56_005975 [Kibdelosporangium banguiense]|uniref:Uncharacterized protein n=1 Tax=Kibdelosporangium banguiense TaxID=1365924 RepID=A0ABS4TMG0_9PSEU|nr:hypothetical protein [Kibdelosporangium banguiense]MBP2325590.1 hypothetical protein [Kibdelosporangium banguiense]
MRTLMPRIGAVGAATGLVTLILGTFLAWTRSGSVYRDSYQSLGLLKQLGFMGAFPALDFFLQGWLAVIPAVAIAIALYALGLRRSAAGLAAVLAILMGTIAGVAAVQGGGTNGLVGIASAGPVVTFIGALLALLGAVTVLVSQRTRMKQQTGGEP